MARVWLALDDLQSRHLPEVCLICGRPADVHTVHQFTWRPHSVSALLWLTTCLCPPLVVVAVILSLLDTRSLTAAWPTCRRHENYWTRRNLWLYGPLWAIALLSLTLALLIITNSAPPETTAVLILGVLVPLLIWAILLAILRRFSLRIVEFTDRYVVFAGVADRFARAVRQQRRDDAQPTTPLWPVYDPYPRLTSAGANGSPSNAKRD